MPGALQKWATHQRESAPLRQRPMSQAALALQRWAAVSKKARAALKRANPASVMQLEHQILDFFERVRWGPQAHNGYRVGNGLPGREAVAFPEVGFGEEHAAHASRTRPASLQEG